MEGQQKMRAAKHAAGLSISPTSRFNFEKIYGESMLEIGAIEERKKKNIWGKVN